jgi:hypothetical protein
MYKFVQGQVDASRKWGKHVEEVIFKELGLLPNRADPVVYSGIFQGHPIILGLPRMTFYAHAKMKRPTKPLLQSLKRSGQYIC